MAGTASFSLFLQSLGRKKLRQGWDSAQDNKRLNLIQATTDCADFLNFGEKKGGQQGQGSSLKVVWNCGW